MWLLPVPTPRTAAAKDNNGAGGRDGLGRAAGTAHIWSFRTKSLNTGFQPQARRLRAFRIVCSIVESCNPTGAGGRSAAGFTYVDAGSVQSQANTHPPPEHQTQRKTSFLSSPQNKLSSGFQFWNVPKIYFLMALHRR